MVKLKSVTMSAWELLTVSQAADALGASSQSIRNRIRGDRVRAVRIGNRFLVPRSEVERMLGDLSSPAGEGHWEFGSDDVAPRLPRAGDREADADRLERGSRADVGF